MKSHGVGIEDDLKALTNAEISLSEAFANPPNKEQLEALANARFAVVSSLGSFCFKKKTLDQSRSFNGGRGILVYLLVAAAILFAYLIWETYYSTNELSDIFETRILFVPVYVYLWGMLGTLAYLLWACLNHIARKDFDNYYIPYYFLRVPMGAILAAITYVFILAGFFSIAVFSVASEDNNSNVTIGNLTEAITGNDEKQADENLNSLPQAPYIVIAFISGFSVRFSMNTLERIIKAAFPNEEDPEKKNASTPQKPQ